LGYDKVSIESSDHEEIAVEESNDEMSQDIEDAIEFNLEDELKAR